MISAAWPVAIPNIATTNAAMGWPDTARIDAVPPPIEMGGVFTGQTPSMKNGINRFSVLGFFAWAIPSGCGS
jgi:hypothetical protein